MNIAVRKSTSFYDSLTRLNAQLVGAGKPPAALTLVPGTLESEDMMEMVAANLLPAVVADDWIAGLWVQILKGIPLTIDRQQGTR